MKNFLHFSVLFLSVLLSASYTFAQPTSESPAASEEHKIVKAIEIQGNKTSSISLILSKIKTRVGQEYIQSVISDDLKRLYNTGYFSDVTVDRQEYEGGFRVIITVEEKPIIDKITFSKTRHINSRTLQQKIQSKPGKFLDSKSLKDDVDIIKEFYSKKGLTMVEVTPEASVDEVTNKAKIHFVIKEGSQIRIRRINVYGNKAYTQKKIVGLIKTRVKWLFNSGFLTEDLLKEDMERIVAFYEQNGYIDAAAEYSLDYGAEGRLAVNIKIDEGKQYFTDEVTIVGYRVVTEKEIRDIMTEAKKGKPFSRAKLSVDVNNIQTLYFDHGYIFAKVTDSTSLNPETGKVDIKLDIKEGDLAYVNKIEIEGNTQTRDIVIRREVGLTPGDKFDGAKLRRTKDRLKALGYFEDVNYDIADTDSPTKKDLVVQVKEAKTGTFSFGGGFSTVDQVVGFIEVEQRNFDFSNWPTFTGGGQNLLIRAETGSVRNNARLSFTEPWFFDYPISAGFDVYRSAHDKERDTGYSYNETRLGGDVRLGKRFNDFLSADMIYRNERIKIEDFDANVSADLLAEEGENTVSSLGFGLTRDERDSLINPTKGLYVNGFVDVAGGVLAGDKDFYRFQPRASYYIPFKFDSVLEVRLRGGYMKPYGDSEKIPIFERFFVGGARTIRGYNERKVGPVDLATDDPLGGEALLVGNLEYVVPLIDFIKLAVFVDSGNVWAEAEDFGSGGFKSGAGLGLRVKTPIGPISVDYGYPLNDEPGEEERSGKFYFNVSRGF